MRFCVHIGTAKTGTTSIQRFLRRNSARLRAHGMATSRTLGERSQVALAVMALPDQPLLRLHRRLGLDTPRQVHQYKARHTDALRDELDDVTSQTVLLSCEQLSWLPDSDESVQRFADWTSGFTDDVDIVVYLRRQDSMLLAHYSQQLRSGHIGSFEVPSPAATGPGSRYDYLSLVRRWERAFGRDALKVRVFERAQLVAGDVIDDYLTVIGLPLAVRWHRPARRNRSLDRDGMEFLRLMNRHIPDRSAGREPLRVDLAPLVEKIAADGPRLALPAEQSAQFMARFEADNAIIAREYLGREDGQLFGSTALDAEGRELSLTVERAVEIAASLWIAKQSEVIELRRQLGTGGGPPEDG